MEQYLIFFGLLLILYLLTQEMTKAISSIIYKFSRSQKTSMYVLAIVFFPGVFIHEVSHFLAASLLGVHAENPEFFPKMIDGRLKLGSVQIHKTDPIRKTLIGVAPIFGGIGMLLASVYLYKTYGEGLFLALFILGILYFQIANTMFSSKKDLEGTGIFFILFLLIGGTLWVFNVPILPFLFQSEFGLFIQGLLQRGSFYLGIAVLLDLFLLFILWLISKLSVR